MRLDLQDYLVFIFTTVLALCCVVGTYCFYLEVITDIEIKKNNCANELRIKNNGSV